MPVTTVRALVWAAAIVAIVAIVVLLRLVPDLARKQEPSVVSAGDTQATPTAASALSREPAHPVAASTPASPPVAQLPSTLPLEAPTTPVHVRVDAPRVASTGEAFDVHVPIEAPNGLHRLHFGIRYDKRMLTLTGVSQGDFAQRGGLPADFASDEPSDGNLEVTFAVRNGLALSGAGNLAVLHFEPLKPGTAAIAVSMLAAFDNSGAVRFRDGTPQRAVIAIH